MRTGPRRSLSISATSGCARGPETWGRVAAGPGLLRPLHGASTCCPLATRLQRPPPRTGTRLEPGSGRLGVHEVQQEAPGARISERGSARGVILGPQPALQRPFCAPCPSAHCSFAPLSRGLGKAALPKLQSAPLRLSSGGPGWGRRWPGPAPRTGSRGQLPLTPSPAA